MAQNRTQKQRRQTRAQNRVANATKREARLAKAQERFTGLLTPKRALHIAKAGANQEYKPVEREIAGEIRGSQAREGEIGNWYQGLDNLTAQQQAEGKASDAATTAAINSQIANSSANSAAGLQQLASQNASRAAMAGGAVSPTLQSTAALGNTNLDATRVALNAPTIAAQSSFQKYTGGTRIANALRGIEARQANAADRKKMGQDLQSARLEKGRAITSGLQKLREGDRNYTVQNKAFGLKSTEAAEQAAHDAASVAATREGHRLTRKSSAESTAASREGNQVSKQNANQTAKNNRIAQEEFEYEKKHGTGSINSKSSGNQKGPTQSEKYDAKRETESVRSAIPDYLQQYHAAGHPIKTNAEWAQFTAEVAKATGAEYSVVVREVNRFRTKQIPKSIKAPNWP